MLKVLKINGKITLGLIFLIVLSFNTGSIIQGEEVILDEEVNGPYIENCTYDNYNGFVQSGDEITVNVKMNEEYYDEVISDNPDVKYPFEVFLSDEEGIDPNKLYELEILSSVVIGAQVIEEVNVWTVTLTIGFESLNGEDVDGDFFLYVLPKDDRILNLDDIYYGVVNNVQQDIDAVNVLTVNVRFAELYNLGHGYTSYSEIVEGGASELRRYLRIEAHDIYAFDGMFLGILPSKTELTNEEINDLDAYTDIMEYIYDVDVDVEYDLDKAIPGNEDLVAVYIDLDDPMFSEFESSSVADVAYEYDLDEEVYYLYYYMTNPHGQTSLYASDNFCIDNLIIRTPDESVIHTNEDLAEFGYKDLRMTTVFFDVYVDEPEAADIFDDAALEEWGTEEDSHMVGKIGTTTFNVRDHFRELNIPGAVGGVNSNLSGIWNVEQTSITFSDFEEDLITGEIDIVSFMDESFGYDFTDGVVYLGYGGLDHMGNSMGKTVRVFVDTVSPTLSASFESQEESSVTYSINLADITGYESNEMYKPDDLAISVYYEVSKLESIDDIETTGEVYVTSENDLRDLEISTDGLESGTYHLHLKSVDYAGNSRVHIAEETFYVEPPIDRLRFPVIDDEDFDMVDSNISFTILFNDNVFTQTDGFGYMLTNDEPSTDMLADASNYVAKSMADNSAFDFSILADESFKLVIDLEDEEFDLYAQHSGFYMTYYFEDVDGHRIYSDPVQLCRDHYEPSITVDNDLTIDKNSEKLNLVATDFHLGSMTVSFSPVGNETVVISNEYNFSNTQEETVDYSAVTMYSNQVGGQIPEGNYNLTVEVTDRFGYSTAVTTKFKVDVNKPVKVEEEEEELEPIPDDIGLQIVIDGKLAISSVIDELNGGSSSSSTYYELTSKDFELGIANSEGDYEIQIREGLQKVGVFKRNKTVVDEGNQTNTVEYITIYVMDQERNSHVIHCIYKEEE